MSKIVFVNRYFYPDHSATSQILSDLAFHLAGKGRDVHVIASRLIYDNPKAELAGEEMINNVRVHRVWTSRFGRWSLVGRGLDYVSFYATALAKMGKVVRRDDVVVAKTDPPLLSVPASAVARLRRARLVNWLQDLYPEVAIALGMKALAGPLARGLTALRNRSLKGAVANVVIGNHMAERLARQGVGRNLIRFIPNWCDDEVIAPVTDTAKELREDWGLTGKFVVGYSGNLGRAHEVATLLDAAEKLRARNDIRFLFIGGGHLTQRLREEAKIRNLESLVFKPYQQRASLAQSLSVADVHWVSLRPECEGLIVPSKFYGIASVARPVIAVTALNGELADLIEAHRCGLVVAVGDSQALADAVVRLAASPVERERMGRRGRAMVSEHFAKSHGLERWTRLLDEVQAP